MSSKADRDRAEQFIQAQIDARLAQVHAINERRRRLMDELRTGETEDYELAFSYLLGRGPHPLTLGRHTNEGQS